MLQEQTEQKQITYIYEPNSYAPLARVDKTHNNQEIYYYHTDQIGTPLKLTNEQGTIVWQANYKAWREIESCRINEIEQNLRYQGQYFDEETDLHYNTFRYYDPQVGRFTTQDPIGLLGGLNFYQYGLSSIAWTDAYGLCSTKLGNNMGAKAGDEMANHHLIPEELIKKYPEFFDRLKSMGWNMDGASNGIFLSGNKKMADILGIPGHWSNHPQYTEAVENMLRGVMGSAENDMDMILGTKAIQDWAREGLEQGLFKINELGRLM